MCTNNHILAWFVGQTPNTNVTPTGDLCKAVHQLALSFCWPFFVTAHPATNQAIYINTLNLFVVYCI